MANATKETNSANATKVVTGEVRLSYAYLFSPRKNDNDKDVWSTSILIKKSDKETLKKLKRAAAEATRAGISNGKLKAGTTPDKAWTTLHDGDERDDLDERPEYAGHFYMSVSAYRKPGIVDRNLQEIIDSSEVYSGCFARASVNAYAYFTKGKRGVTFGLNHIQKLRDGDFLGGVSRAEDDFDALDDEDDAGYITDDDLL